MRVLLVSTSDSGGAGIACLRLFRALRNEGADVKMLVKEKRSTEEGVFAWTDAYRGNVRKIKKLQGVFHDLRSKRKNDRVLRGRTYAGETFTPPWPALPLRSHPLVRWAEVVHLHWCAQFWNWSAFQETTGKSLFWTMHDLNPATGGCHYPGECTQFNNHCVLCPQLKGTANARIVEPAFRRKKKILDSHGGRRITIISPSNWISAAIRQSSLFRDNPRAVVGNAFDETIFHPIKKAFCREVLDIPPDRKVVLFAANYLSSHRKGADLIVEALSSFAGSHDVVFCAAGYGTVGSNSVPIRLLGNIQDERLMAIAYNAADVFAIPSREDNLPNTVAESLLCGTPVVGFNRGGIGEMIQDNVNGLLVEDVAISPLASSIQKALGTVWNRDLISKGAQERYGQKRIARMHLDLYAKS